MKLKELIEQYGDYEVTETKGDWCDAGHVTLELNKPKPRTVYDLEDGEYCFVIADCEEPWGTEYHQCELEEQREQGNVFMTKKEAEQDLERRKVETLLIKHGGRRWFKECKENWFITFDRSVCLCFFKYSIRDQRQGMIYFDTEEELTEAVEQIGEERIIKALFEVR